MTNLKKAFDDAKQWKAQKNPRLMHKPGMLGASMEEDWKEAKTKFEKDKMDIMLDYDQNKNEQAVSKEQEEQLRFVMQIVQQQATSQFAALGQNFTRDPELWIQFYARYPLLFNFRERESKHFEKKEFSLDANAELIEECLGANTPKNIADSFMRALRVASSRVIDSSSENEHLQYLTLIRTYDKASTITIYRAELKLEVSKVKTVCGGVQKQDLVIDYDRTVLEINNMLAFALYPSLIDAAKTELIERMTQFFLQWAKAEFDEFEKWLKNPAK